MYIELHMIFSFWVASQKNSKLWFISLQIKRNTYIENAEIDGVEFYNNINLRIHGRQEFLIWDLYIHLYLESMASLYGFLEFLIFEVVNILFIFEFFCRVSRAFIRFFKRSVGLKASVLTDWNWLSNRSNYYSFESSIHKSSIIVLRNANIQELGILIRIKWDTFLKNHFLLGSDFLRCQISSLIHTKIKWVCISFRSHKILNRNSGRINNGPQRYLGPVS